MSWAKKLTDDVIADLLRADKRRIEPWKVKAKPGHYEAESRLSCAACEHPMFALVRLNKIDRTNFSVGLRVEPVKEDNVILVRYNGCSHGHHNPIEKERLAPQFHKHVATRRYLLRFHESEGREASWAEPMSTYDDISGAFATMIRECAISGLEPPSFPGFQPRLDLTSFNP